MKLKVPIEVAVLKEDENGERDVTAIKQIEWRQVLNRSRFQETAELYSLHQKDVSVGLLELAIELLPKVNTLDLFEESKVFGRFSNDVKLNNYDILKFRNLFEIVESIVSPAIVFFPSVWANNEQIPQKADWIEGWSPGMHH